MANCRLRSRSWNRPFGGRRSFSIPRIPARFTRTNSLTRRGSIFPRSYVDVNREPYELDPRMFTGRLPSFANTRSMRVAGGLGTIPRVVGDGQEIYRERLSVEDALLRIDALYKPYHRALRRLINRVHQTFGASVVVDCHSMPSIGVSRDEPRRPDMVIGDRYGTSCAAGLADMVEETMRQFGYSVGRNKPYAGGFITEHYGK